MTGTGCGCKVLVAGSDGGVTLAASIDGGGAGEDCEEASTWRKALSNVRDAIGESSAIGGVAGLGGNGEAVGSGQELVETGGAGDNERSRVQDNVVGDTDFVGV